MIATSHREHLGLFSAARPASLEVFPAGQHMLDDIVTSFVYVERLREQRRVAASAAG